MAQLVVKTERASQAWGKIKYGSTYAEKASIAYRCFLCIFRGDPLGKEKNAIKPFAPQSQCPP